MNVNLLHYTLQCRCCGKEYLDYFDRGFLLSCPEEHPPALLKTIYTQTTFEVQPELPGMFRYAHWLPVCRTLKTAPRPIVYQSKGLGLRLGLENLWIAFNGYWPAKGAFMESCTFKELEAPPVCARIPEDATGTLIVASAGNTARAFLQVCSEYAMPVVVVVPEVGLPWLWMTRERHPCTKIVVLSDGDYFDAIRLGKRLARNPGFFSEGGAHNISRRDGLGTVLLSAVESIGQIPQHYFQSVGSGTGGIAVWEMNQRLSKDSRFGAAKMTLHLSQNAPFAPMVDAWTEGSRTLLPGKEHEQKAQLLKTRAHVLSNRQPPYALIGGVYDALCDSHGYMYSVSNKEALEAGQEFLREEGCDLDPAAEVTVASLLQALKLKKVNKKDLMLLNITGGGYSLLKQHKHIYHLQPDEVLTLDDLEDNQLAEYLQRKLQ
jgi:cysteate synthase